MSTAIDLSLDELEAHTDHPFLTTADLADLLVCTQQHIRDLAHEGKLPGAFLLGARSMRVDRSLLAGGPGHDFPTFMVRSALADLWQTTPRSIKVEIDAGRLELRDIGGLARVTGASAAALIRARAFPVREPA